MYDLNSQEYNACIELLISDIEYAKKIALQDEQMKKKIRSLLSVNEIIYVNNNLVIKE